MRKKEHNPDFVQRVYGLLGKQKADKGVPKDMRLVYVSNVTNFLYMAQGMQIILPALSFAVLYATGKNLYLPDLNNFMQGGQVSVGMAAAIMFFISLHGIVSVGSLRLFPVRIYAKEDGSHFAVVYVHPFLPMCMAKPITFSAGEATSKPFFSYKAAARSPCGRLMVLDEQFFKTPYYYHAMLEGVRQQGDDNDRHY